MTHQNQMELKFKIGRVFTPSAPINDAALFAGRRAQITTLVNAVTQRGQHAVLFGERGVGKTSLTNVIKNFLGVRTDFIVVSTNCEANTSFKSIWANVLGEIAFTQTAQGMGFNPSLREQTDSLASILSEKPSPEEIRQILQRLEKPSIVVIDEIDRIKDPQVTTRLADTIKTLSDHSTDATLVLVGVADSLDVLISEHRSIERAIVQIQMPRMSNHELQAIIDQGLHQLGMNIHFGAKSRIAGLSHGLPHYTHSLALHAAQAAVDRDSLEINQDDVVAAVNVAIAQAQQSIVRSYHDATASPRGNLYAEVLLACALAKTDDLGYFSAADVRDPMSKIMKRRYEIPAFAQHLNDFCTDKRGKVLQKTGHARRYRFRFVNPLLEPFVVMNGIAKTLIEPDVFDPGANMEVGTTTGLLL